MRTIISAFFSMVILSHCLPATADQAEEAKLLPVTLMQTTQVALGTKGPIALAAGTRADFAKHVNARCSQPEGAVPAIAPVAGVIAGMIVDFLFSKALAKLEAALQEKLKTYSSAQQSPSWYSDVHDASLWSSAGESCLIAQRVHCRLTQAQLDSGNPSCEGARNYHVSASAAVVVRRNTAYWQVQPLAMEFNRMTAAHSGGNGGFAVGIEVHAIALQQNAGSRWKSGELAILGAAFSANRPREGAQANVDLLKTYGNDVPWHSLPAPPNLGSSDRPAAHAVFVWKFAEVGEPPRGLKGLAEFISANKDDLSATFAKAAKAKLGVPE